VPWTGWTPQHSLVTIRVMRRGFQIEKLSDEFGQYTLVLKCSECGHERKAEPHTLGRLCGWDAPGLHFIAEIVRDCNFYTPAVF
jgi:hypothetical protein